MMLNNSFLHCIQINKNGKYGNKDICVKRQFIRNACNSIL